MGKITPVGVVLLAVMVAGFAYGFLGHGEAAGISLLIAALVLLLVAGASFTRGGRAGFGQILIAAVEAEEERRTRKAEKADDL